MTRGGAPERAAPTHAARVTTRRERLLVLAFGVVGAAIALLAATRSWLLVTVADPLAGNGRLHPHGSDVAALVPAAALVALAGAVAAVTMRRVGRQVAGLLLVAAGAGIAAATGRVMADPRAAIEQVLRDATGRTGNVAATADVSGGWPYLALVGGLLVVLAGALTVVRGRAWSGLSSRYEPPAEAASDDAWDALSRGEDPTG
jgi:uncharacterized membrane protein (TIGR02234 family)